MPDEADQGRQREAQRFAGEWTDELLHRIFDLGTAPDRVEAPASPVDEVDLSDVANQVLRYGRQIRRLRDRRDNVPVLLIPDSATPLTVDFGAAIGSDEPTDPTRITPWLNQARIAVQALAVASSFAYTELSTDHVTRVLGEQTLSFVTTRFLGSSWFGGGDNTHKIRVHAKGEAAGFRVYYSLGMGWNPVVFGEPTPIVEGRLEAGWYRFGINGEDVAKIKQDPGVFRIPEGGPDFRLNVP